MADLRAPLILVVEDDFLTRMNAVDLLQGAGFSVLSAPTADAAVETLSERDDVAAVFTDVRMPGTIDGLHLAAVVQASRPWVGIVITSGWSFVAEDALPRGARFLQKPYRSSDLVETFRSVGVVTTELRPI